MLKGAFDAFNFSSVVRTADVQSGAAPDFPDPLQIATFNRWPPPRLHLRPIFSQQGDEVIQKRTNLTSLRRCPALNFGLNVRPGFSRHDLPYFSHRRLPRALNLGYYRVLRRS